MLNARRNTFVQAAKRQALKFEFSYLVECALFFLAPPSGLACSCLVWKNLLVLWLPQVSQPSANISHSVPNQAIFIFATVNYMHGTSKTTCGSSAF